MRTKCGFWVAALALLSFLSVFSPHHAQATATTTMCNDGQFDANVNNNRDSFKQSLSNLAHQINLQFPMLPALGQCVTNMINLFPTSAALADPEHLATMILVPLINGIITQVCSQVMSTIKSVEQGLLNMTKICLPLPNFSLSLPKFGSSSCSGGIAISPLTVFFGNTPTSYYPYQYRSQ